MTARARHVLDRQLEIDRAGPGELTAYDREDARTPLGQITHFLDVPVFLAIVYYGAIRPDSWTHVLAVIAAAGRDPVLTAAVPQLARPR